MRRSTSRSKLPENGAEARERMLAELRALSAVDDVRLVPTMLEAFGKRARCGLRANPRRRSAVELDRRGMSRGTCERAIRGEERRVERLRKGDIRRVERA